DNFPATVLPLDPDSDYWFWDFIISGDATDGRKQFAISVPSMASDSGATLQVRLQGALSDTSHRARIRLNGVMLGDVVYRGLPASTPGRWSSTSPIVSGRRSCRPRRAARARSRS